MHALDVFIRLDRKRKKSFSVSDDYLINYMDPDKTFSIARIFVRKLEYIVHMLLKCLASSKA